MGYKDEIECKGKQIDGEMKDEAGQFVTNPDLRAKGDSERVEGKAREKSGDVRRTAREAVMEKAAESISGKR